MARVYATAEQLVAWTGKPAPSDAARLLARASEDVDDALLTAVYDTDDGGMPTDPDVIQALSDATCAQVEYWAESGSEGIGGEDRWDNVSIGPVAMSGRRRTTSGPGEVDLGPRAYRALQREGLLPGEVDG